MAAGMVSTASAMMAQRHPFFMVEASPVVLWVTGPAKSTIMSAKWLQADLAQGATQARSGLGAQWRCKAGVSMIFM